jgi:hypothetical protein
MYRGSLTRLIAAALLAGLCVLMLPVKADAAPLDVGSVVGVKLWTHAFQWLRQILPGAGSEPPAVAGPPKFGAGQSSDGRAKSGRTLPPQAQ